MGNIQTTLAQPSNLYPTYNRAKPIFTNGRGAWLETQEGDWFLDFSSGIAVNTLGHNHPHLVNALQSAANGIWHLSNLFEIPGQTRLAARLCANSFADRVFMTNSGAEAVECAIKSARKFFAATGHADRHKILTFEGAFHGRTLATIAAGGQEKYLEGFGPKVEGFVQLPFGDHETLKAYDFTNVAAILVEPIQGEGGIRVLPDECLRGLRNICNETGTLLIFDEIQCGVGRTGAFFAHEPSGITPDIMAIAKGIGGGFPIGACLATEAVSKHMIAGTHGTTFGGNPLAMSVANAVLDILLEDQFLESVKKASAHLAQGLDGIIQSHPKIFKAQRGVGLLRGIECIIPNTDVLAAINAENMLVVPAGNNVIRLLPPLNVTTKDISEGLNKISSAAVTLEKGL